MRRGLTAPGNNLEFEDLPEFERRCARIAGLREKVLREIRNHLLPGKSVFGPVRKIEVEMGNRAFVAFYGRRRNKIGLIEIFDLRGERLALKAFEAELVRRYRDWRQP
jgi:hypothetical protein